MGELLLTLVGGVAAICVAFFMLFRFSPLSAKQSGLVVLLTSQVFYLPLAIMYWPGADVLAIHVAVFAVTSYVLTIIASQYAASRQSEDNKRWIWVFAYRDDPLTKFKENYYGRRKSRSIYY